jgi:diguanylate cyclase (GGDEF)-like protein
MDYGTFFFTNIASVTVFTVCIGVLAWYNRRVVGMPWFAAAQIVGLAKLILQGQEGKVPAIWTGMTANELYLVSIAMQWMGLYWFIVRKPFMHRRLWIPTGVVLVVYTGSFLGKIPYTGNLINLPFIVLCGFSAWTLWKHSKGPFAAVARVSAAIAAAQACVAFYRAALTNIHYVRPWETVIAHNDSRWLYSLAAAAFLAGCMSMCEMWFLVTELQWELAERARTDSLTGALNRRSMEEAALRESARSLRYGNALSMIVLDIDNFKRLNDTLGHAAGDCALQALVRSLNDMLREQDSLARTGGEEFAILLPDTSGPGALTIAERLRHAVADLEIRFDTGPIRMTICAGVAQFDPASNWEEMMRRADCAMYEAKRCGRNRVSAHSESTMSSGGNPGGADSGSFKLLPFA